MINRIKQTFERFPDKPAFVIGGTRFTFGELQYKIAGISEVLKQQVVNENHLVGIFAKDNLDSYASIVACWCCGLGYVPFDPGYPVERNMQIIENLKLKLMLSCDKPSKEFDARLKEGGVEIVETKSLVRIGGFPKPAEVPDGSVAYMLFTSGTTGHPKGVPVSRKNLTSYMNAFFSCGYSIGQDDKILQMFNLTFDMSVMSFMIGLYTGAPIYTAPAGTLKYLSVIQIMQDEGITVALKTPSVISFLRSYFNEIQLPELRYSIFAGEALYRDVTEAWSSCIPNAQIHNVYGPTEALGCWFYDCTPSHKGIKSYNGIISIGKPYINMEGIVVGEDGRILPAGEKGELCIAGFQLFEGYWKDEEKNKQSFLSVSDTSEGKKFYKTGDLCFIDDSGDFMYVGRNDSQVKIDGFRVELSEIEYHAKKITNKDNIAVVAIKEQAGHYRLLLFIEQMIQEPIEILEQLKQFLPPYMIPHHVESVSQMPMNPNGKIDRNKLKATYATKQSE